MTSHLWCWSEIVNPRLVEAAMADEERRARRKRRTSDAPVVDEKDRQPVAA